VARSQRVYAIDQGTFLCHCTRLLILICIQLIRELYSVTEASANGDDQSQKGTQLLEIYALEIQMHNETKNYKKLKASSLFILDARSDASPLSGDLQRFQ